jgi:hypothetical protein
MINKPGKRWYVRDHFGGQPRQVWLIDERTATRLGVSNPAAGAGTYFEAESGENIWDCIGRLTPWLNSDGAEGRFHLMALGPAEFYPRIARPNALAIKPALWSPCITSERAFIASARAQLTLLVRRLGMICQTIQPSPRTLDVYGHEIRNLLILAATEAEMHWRGILAANRPSIQQFNTNECAKLIEPLKLVGYQVTYHDFPALEPVRPFAGWTKADPTKSLSWYAAYHGVKHNRDTEFQRGTLRCTSEAVSACLALLVAQFGPVVLNTELSNSVELQVPAWPVGEMYLPQVTDATWMAVEHPDI